MIINFKTPNFAEIKHLAVFDADTGECLTHELHLVRRR